MKDKKRGHRVDEIDTSDIENPDVHHERIDVPLRPILWFAIGLTISTVVIYAFIGWLFQAFEEREKKSQGKQSPLAAERQRVPPEPRLYLSPKDANKLDVNLPNPNILSDHPFQELRKLREGEAKMLNQYNWVDPNAGVVTIPIDEAKRLVLQRGLIVSRPAPVQSATGEAAAREEMPSDSSSGQQTEKKQQ
jgi:hypothetical protein